MFETRRVAVVVPAYNEERLLPRVLQTMPDWVDEVVVVDDGSRDGTGAIAARWGQEPGVRVSVVRHPRNLGVGAAIATGYRHALDGGADVVAVMAGDAQMAPEELARLVLPAARGEADYVKGDRTGHAAFRARMPLVRRLGNAGLTAATRWVTGYQDLRDAQCGYTAARAEALRELPLDRLWPRYGYPNDLLARFAEADARVVERVVSPIYGDEVSGLSPWRALGTHTFVLLRAAARRALRRTRRRARRPRALPGRI